MNKTSPSSLFKCLKPTDRRGYRLPLLPGSRLPSRWCGFLRVVGRAALRGPVETDLEEREPCSVRAARPARAETQSRQPCPVGAQQGEPWSGGDSGPRLTRSQPQARPAVLRTSEPANSQLGSEQRSRAVSGHPPAILSPPPPTDDPATVTVHEFTHF